MTNEQLNELLARAVADQSYKIGGRAGGAAALKKLAKETARADLPLPAGKDLPRALAEIGTFLERGEDAWVLLVDAGVGGMNKAVLAASLEGDMIHVQAWAKEGLIKQHTAEKAIDRLKAALL